MISYLSYINPQLDQTIQKEAIHSSKLRHQSCWSISVFSKSINFTCVIRHIFVRNCFLSWIWPLEYSPYMYNTLTLIIDIVNASRCIFISLAQTFFVCNMPLYLKYVKYTFREIKFLHCPPSFPSRRHVAKYLVWTIKKGITYSCDSRWASKTFREYMRYRANLWHFSCKSNQQKIP